MVDVPRAVTVVIVHYRSCGDVARLCADLSRQDHPALDVVVVECGDDGSVAAARNTLGPVPSTLVDPGGNLGYCAGNNLGFRERRDHDVLVVNPDVRLPDPATIRLLHAALATDDTLAAVGPVIETPAGLVEHAGARVDRRRGEAVHVRTSLPAWPDDLPRDGHPVPWLNGCCWLIRGHALDEVGGLDERFFLFFEEVDWALRAGAAGWRLAIVATTAVRHTRSAAFGRSQKGAYYYWRNNYLLFRTHVGRGPWMASWLRRLLRFCLAPRHVRDRSALNAAWGGLDALRGRTGPRPGRP